MAVDPNIPSVPSTVPTDQVPWFTAVKGCIEILMGQGRNTDANRALRVSEYRAGITKIQESLPEYILAQSMDIPAPPTNLIITKGVWSHHLTWDNPTDEIVSHIEIWVATNSQDRSNAVIRGVVTVTENLRGKKGSFDFSGLNVTDDLVYWIRSISYAGNHSIWEPPDDQGGYVVPGDETLDETINDIMDILKGSITEDQLYIDLSSRIDLIDFPATGLIDRIAGMDFTINNPVTGLLDRIATMEVAIESMPLFESNVAYSIDDMVTYSGKIYVCIQDTNVPPPLPTDTSYWEQIGSSASIAGEVSANALEINRVKNRVVIAEGGITAISESFTALQTDVGGNTSAIQTERTARVNEDEALATSIDTLASTVGANTSAIQTERTARVNEDEALATSIDTLASTVGANTSAIQTERTARVNEDEALAREATLMETRFGVSHAALSQEIETRTGPDSALAQSINTLFAETDNNRSAIQTEQEARTTAISAEASKITTLQAKVGTSSSTIQERIEAIVGPDSATFSKINTLQAIVGPNGATIQDKIDASVGPDSAIANAIKTVQSKLGNNFSSVETVSKAIDGIEASHTIKVQADSNGKLVMAGIGLIADSVTKQSEIMMMANQFQIVIPGATPGSVPTQPFIIKNIDGVDTVGISGNLVIDGKILGKHIEANSITAAHLSSTEIFTMKLVVGSGSTGFSNFTDGCPADADRTIDSDFVKVTYPADKATLQNQIDGKVESWFQSNDPATAWTTTAIKQLHNGDWWWNTSTQKLKRYTGTGWSVDLTDKTAIDAFDKASTAQSTADGKMVVFTTTPSNYDVGDLWDVGGNPRILKRATRARTTYVAGDWITIANEVTNTNQVTDGAGLGLKADWQYVTGDGKPADNADKTSSVLPSNSLAWKTAVSAAMLDTTVISGGYIKTSLIKTDAIVIGDLSGAGDLASMNRSNLKYTDGADKTNYTLILEDAATKANAARDAAKTFATAEAERIQVLAEAHADGIVTAAEERSIADATTKADAAREAAIAAAALDAIAKANAAQATAEAYALAEANRVRTEADAYADGIVTTAEAAAIQDATDKAEAARIAAIAAAKAHTEGWSSEGADVTPSLPSDEGLIGYWSFDEGSGSIVKDSSRHKNDGVIAGAPEWVPGVSGGALKFSTGGDMIVPIRPIEVSGAFSFSFWLDRDDVISTWKAVANFPSANVHHIIIDASNRLGHWCGGMKVSGHMVPADGTPHHYVVIIDEDSQTWTLYFDGAFYSQIDTNPLLFQHPISHIGGGHLYAINSILDEVRIYNVVLTPQEVKALYLNPGGMKAPTPGADVTDYAAIEADAQAKANAARDTAKTFATAEAERIQVLADAHADGIVTAAEGRAIADATTKANAAKAAAIAAAAADAATKANAARDTAKAFATAEAERIQVLADAHADGIVTAAEGRAIADATTKANAAKAAAISAAAADAKAKADQALIDAKADAQARVDALEIGGRNLLRNSGTPVSNAGYPIQSYGLTQTLEEGEQVTISFKGTLARESWAFYNSGGTVQMVKVFPQDIIKDNLFVKTFNWKIGNSSNTDLRVYPIPSASPEPSEIEWIKLERGPKATDWTPAPEDVQAQFDEYTEDSKLTPLEKQQISRTWDEIQKEKAGLLSQAAQYPSVSTTSFTTAFTLLSNYLTSSILTNLTATTGVVRATFNSQLSAYYQARETFIEALTLGAKNYTEAWSSKGADKTQTALDLGASIDKAKANGSTLIVGGYIRTSLIKTDAIVIGDLYGASTFTAYNTNRVNGTAASTVVSNASTGAAAATTVNSWKYPNTTYIDGGNIYTNTIVANHILANEITVDKIYKRAGINGRRIGMSETGVISVVYESIYIGGFLDSDYYFTHTIHHGLGRHCIVQAFYKKPYGTGYIYTEASAYQDGTVILFTDTTNEQVELVYSFL